MHEPLTEAPVAHRPSDEARKTIYTCVNNGKTMLADAPCGNIVATHPARVAPPHERARTYREQYEALVAQRKPQPVPVEAQRSQRGEPSAAEKKQRCEEIDRHIKYLDAMARQPHSGQAQDQLRQQRREAMDRRAKVCR